MDEARVRECAEGHATAIVDGNLRRASADLTDEAKQSAPAVMSGMPRPVRSARVTEVVAAGDAVLATIVYSGDDEQLTVESKWVDRDGRPMISELALGS